MANSLYALKVNNRWDIVTILADDHVFGETQSGATLDKLLPPGWGVYAHHCTVYFGEEDKIPANIKLFIDNHIDQRIYLEVLGYGISEACTALKVRARVYDLSRDYVMTEFQCQNEIAHITLAVAPHHKPMESNDIKDWKHTDMESHYRRMNRKCYIPCTLIKVH